MGNSSSRPSQNGAGNVPASAGNAPARAGHAPARAANAPARAANAPARAANAPARAANAPARAANAPARAANAPARAANALARAGNAPARAANAPARAANAPARAANAPDTVNHPRRGENGADTAAEGADERPRDNGAAAAAEGADEVRDDKETNTTNTNLPIIRMVVAIDFGSYASGYALQWRSDYERDKLKVVFNKRWSTMGMATTKTLTCLLLRPDGELADFGYEAERKYRKMGPEEREKWFLFRNYKMALYRRGHLSDQTPIAAVDGKHLPAIDVFSKSIQYMKNHVLGYLKTSNLPYPEQETQWVLTVPAIWDDPAKQVMRNAAEQAGIQGDRLTIALEPEAATIYCSLLPKDQLMTSDGVDLTTPGSTIMVVDMGGGTVDITTVRLQDDGTFSHVYKSGGGNWGGMKVNEKFVQQVMIPLVGREVWARFATEAQSQEFDFQMSFETAKRDVKYSSDTSGSDSTWFSIPMPDPLKKMWKQATGKKISDVLENHSQFAGRVRFSEGRLEFDCSLIWPLFSETIDEIVRYVEDGLSLKGQGHTEIKVDAMILCGAFAESDYVTESLQRRLKYRSIAVVRPPLSESAVLNGAVLFGQDDKIVSARVLRHTYGVGMVMEYNPRIHNQEMSFKGDDGTLHATNVFRRHAMIGDKVKPGQWVSLKEYSTVDPNENFVEVYIFATDKERTTHTTDEGCKYIGKIPVEFGKTTEEGRTSKAVTVDMSFGETELKVRVTDTVTGAVYPARFCQ